MYIVVTNVDKRTRQACTDAPMTNGVAFPALNNLVIEWQDESNWPVQVENGVYLTAPKYYGTCDDDSFTGFPGVLEVVTEEEYNARREAEMAARPVLEQPEMPIIE